MSIEHLDIELRQLVESLRSAYAIEEIEAYDLILETAEALRQEAETPFIVLSLTEKFAEFNAAFQRTQTRFDLLERENTIQFFDSSDIGELQTQLDDLYDEIEDTHAFKTYQRSLQEAEDALEVLSFRLTFSSTMQQLEQLQLCRLETPKELTLALRQLAGLQKIAETSVSADAACSKVISKMLVETKTALANARYLASLRRILQDNWTAVCPDAEADEPICRSVLQKLAERSITELKQDWKRVFKGQAQQQNFRTLGICLAERLCAELLRKHPTA